jgi:hypothetical protein
MGRMLGRDRLSLEKAVETTDGTDDTDRQGQGLGSPHTCELSTRPGRQPEFQPRPSVESVKSVVKTSADFRLTGSNPSLLPLHLRHLRHPRKDELPASG